ncbi:MAG TPA: nucleotide exchange factor GrpE [Patescibacteria group bacterium]|nr:nucleotide exchange factor GrpE [Patescibacteria group bacterium]
MPNDDLQDQKDENLEEPKEAEVKEEPESEDKKSFFHRDCKHCEKYKAERDEFKAGWQRALADYKNLQQEIANRRGEWVQMSEQQILEEFIPIYENFKKAFGHHPELDGENEEHKKMKNWIQGVGYIMKQYGDVLKSHGVEEIKTVDEKFDPRFHEASGEEESDKEAGTILREVAGGYTMGGRVIKVAKVIIAK